MDVACLRKEKLRVPDCVTATAKTRVMVAREETSSRFAPQSLPRRTARTKVYFLSRSVSLSLLLSFSFASDAGAIDVQTLNWDKSRFIKRNVPHELISSFISLFRDRNLRIKSERGEEGEEERERKKREIKRGRERDGTAPDTR